MAHVDEIGRPAGPDSQQSTPLSPKLFFDSEHEREHESDIESCATTVPETVMAEQVANDVVKEAQSVGRPAPIDDSASTTNTPAVNGGPPSGAATIESNTLSASSSTPNANGLKSASADSVHVSEKAGGQAATVSSERKQSDAPSHDSRHPLLNGDSSEHSAAESQAVADASGGSDTDISRPGSVDQSKRDASHNRTNSTLKKPSTFKSVSSLTKTFLAKSATSTPVPRQGEKAAPAVQPKASSVLTAKPRLVAKSGASNAPRTLGKVNGATAGPDASKVWNKNQPVPPPPPKQFTDEELKQQYGIHLATRLQADEGGKEAKWADIDDDEDDWAPDTVQWMDGTKSSVTAPPEDVPPPAPEPKTILKPEAKPEALAEAPEPEPAPATNTPKPSVTRGTKTILKPGAHAQPAGTKSSLVLKGQPEKPTLVAKPSATEKKSPWAPLPPVERVSPVQINSPAQQVPLQRFSQRDSYGYDSMPPPPAKEIAPDDFNRSWRNDGSGRDGRELFNSQSGRYEPVHNDMRRPSVRDAGYRQQPSLLQRPSQDGPAEPSAAFQTSRASNDMPTWGRRRNSSNVSGGMPRRMSIDRRALDMPSGPMNTERRESHSVSVFDPSEPIPRQSPFAQAASPSIAQADPAFQDKPAPVAAPTPAPPAEDPVEVQKRLMADKIERARQKKQQEQEAEKKAEAERKERIAKKLAAMGPPTDSKPKAKDQSPSRVSEQTISKEKPVSTTAQSPPKPPMPTADGEVTQYGMMKVHQPHPVVKSPQTEQAQISNPSQQAQSAPDSLAVKAQTIDDAKAPSHNQQPTQSFDTFTNNSSAARQPIELSNGASPSGPRPQVHQAAWSPATAPQPRPWTSQVWGPPPTKERALGNGTFDSGYNRGQSRSVAQTQLPVQPPTSTTPIELSLAQQPSNLPPARPVPQAPTMYAQRPLPVQAAAAPSRPARSVAPVTANGWGSFSSHIAQDDKDTRERHQQERERQGEAFRPEIRETYKVQRGQAQITKHDQVAGHAALSEGGLTEGPSPQQSLSQGTLQQGSGPRASRFFPRPAEATPPAATVSSSKADSPPPPPETETHPAFTGDTGHPLVRLPKPSPVVRLPPASGNGATAASVSMPSRGQALGARPLAMNPEWQARFNKLLDKPGSARASTTLSPTSTTQQVLSPVQGALAPAALSKASLDVRGNIGAATVSLPIAPQTNVVSDRNGNDVVTRKGAEALFEDREFGSLPTVKLSKVPHLAADKPSKAAPKDDQNLRYKKFENPFTIRRLEAFDIEKTPQNAYKYDVAVRLPNMSEAVVKSVQRKRRPQKPNAQFKPKQNGVPTTTAGGPKDRPRKPSQQGQVERSNNATRSSVPNAWSGNNRPSPAHQATTWAKRAAAPVQ